MSEGPSPDNRPPPGRIPAAMSLTCFVLGAMALIAALQAGRSGAGGNDWSALGAAVMLWALAGAVVVLWLLSLISGLLAARHRPRVWWWTGPLAALALAAAIGWPARYYWLERQRKARWANALGRPPAASLSSPATTPTSANRPPVSGFAGPWHAEFFFERNTANPGEARHLWMAFDLTLSQSGTNVTGVLRSGRVDGKVSGQATARALRGTLRLSWDERDWDELSLDLSEDGWSGRGKAVFGASATEKHHYAVTLTRR